MIQKGLGLERRYKACVGASTTVDIGRGSPALYYYPALPTYLDYHARRSFRFRHALVGYADARSSHRRGRVRL